MKVYHYSPWIIKEIKDANCTHLRRGYFKGTYNKPMEGLWISTLGKKGWANCYPYIMGPNAYKYRYTITLKKSPRIRILESEKDIRKFEEKFGREREENPNIYSVLNYGADRFDQYEKINIRWGDVCKTYDAFMMKYWKSWMKSDKTWYSDWDCKSGVIFKTRIIKNIKMENIDDIE